MTVRQILSLFFKAHEYLTLPVQITIELDDAQNLIGKDMINFDFYWCSLSRIYQRKNDGWKIFVGRTKTLRPIHYFDKNKELILIYKTK